MNFLDDEERTQLKAQHKKERDKKICDRIKAVLLYDKDWSFQKIAEALLLTEQAIRCQVDEYKSSKKLNLLIRDLDIGVPDQNGHIILVQPGKDEAVIDGKLS